MGVALSIAVILSGAISSVTCAGGPLVLCAGAIALTQQTSIVQIGAASVVSTVTEVAVSTSRCTR